MYIFGVDLHLLLPNLFNKSYSVKMRVSLYLGENNTCLLKQLQNQFMEMFGYDGDDEMLHSIHNSLIM